jgi:hypothetical protein
VVDKVGQELFRLFLGHPFNTLAVAVAELVTPHYQDTL